MGVVSSENQAIARYKVEALVEKWTIGDEVSGVRITLRDMYCVYAELGGYHRNINGSNRNTQWSSSEDLDTAE